MTKIIYHSQDFDGICSAAIAFRALNKEADLIPMDYGDVFPWESINDRETIVMLDFSLPLWDMLRLNKISNLIWIDHHYAKFNEYIEFYNSLPIIMKNKTNNKYKDILFELNRIYPNLDTIDIDTLQLLLHIKGERNNNFSACEIAWKFFNDANPIPYAVEYLGRYDVWSFSIPDTLQFQYGARSIPELLQPRSKEWDILLQNDMSYIDKIIELGYTILDYEVLQNSELCKNFAFETEFLGMKAIVLNKAKCGSLVFKSIWDSEKYDIMIGFVRIGKIWKVSLYSDKNDIDCSVIAKKFGGGGHKGAAGFQCKSLPF